MKIFDKNVIGLEFPSLILQIKWDRVVWNIKTRGRVPKIQSCNSKQETVLDSWCIDFFSFWYSIRRWCPFRFSPFSPCWRVTPLKHALKHVVPLDTRIIPPLCHTQRKTKEGGLARPWNRETPHRSIGEWLSFRDISMWITCFIDCLLSRRDEYHFFDGQENSLAKHLINYHRGLVFSRQIVFSQSWLYGFRVENFVRKQFVIETMIFF